MCWMCDKYGTTAVPMTTNSILPKCPYCAGWHGLEQCPRIKSIVYHHNGEIAKIEFFEANPVSITFQDLYEVMGGDM